MTQSNQIPAEFVQQIPLAFQFPVLFGENVFARNNTLLKNLFSAGRVTNDQKILCFIDSHLVKHFPALPENVSNYLNTVSDCPHLVTPPFILDGGEQLKNRMDLVQDFYSYVSKYEICRHSYLLAIGGGTIIDIVGFSAATSHRGVRMIRVPTTVLSQSDAALGVKTSMNFAGKKNFVGTFTPPYAVVCDHSLLASLSDRFFLSGFSEALKVALLKDEPLLTFIESNCSSIRRRDSEVCRYVIYKCARHHLDHIAMSGDPFEFGSSRPLDFGHWAAHKLEQMSDFLISHGESVAIGVSLDITYSYLSGLLSEVEWCRALNAFCNLGFTIYSPIMETELDTSENDTGLLHGLEEFRQHLGGELTIMLLKQIGCGHEVGHIDLKIMKEAILQLRHFDSNARRTTKPFEKWA